MNKVLSIIIPTYNMEKYLDKCLTSLMVKDKDLMKQFEVLVIIDGAKDRSSAIAHSYQNSYPDTFRVIDKENGNYGSCINRGIKEATGKYVKVLDSDDYFNNKSFSEYLEKLKIVDVDLVLTNCSLVDDNGCVMGTYSLDEKIVADKILPIENLSIPKVMVPLQMHNLTYKVSNLREMDYSQTEGISYTDEEWDTKPMAKVNSVVFYPLDLYQYLLGREGQTVDPQVVRKKYNDWETLSFSLIDNYENYNGNAHIHEFFKQKAIELSSALYRKTLKEKLFEEKVLREYDRKLKNKSKSIYKLVEDSIVVGDYKYLPIKNWRMGDLYFYQLLFTKGMKTLKQHYYCARYNDYIDDVSLKRYIDSFIVKLSIGKYLKK